MNNLKQFGFYYGALLYAFLIPFPQKIVNIALFVWVVLSLVSCSKSTLVKNKYFWLLPAFYFLYFIGFFTTEKGSFKFLEYKLSLLIFPILFFLHGYEKNQRNGILKAFVWGLLASGLTCLVLAFYNSIEIQNGIFTFQANVLEGKGFMESILYGGNYFFGRYLSIFHQTVYYAMYLCSGVAVLLFRPKLFSITLRTILLGVFLILIFLVSNKASFIALGIIFALKLWSWNVKRSKKAIGILSFSLAIVLVVLSNPRIKESVINIVEGKMALNKEERYGFGTRLLSWDASISLVKERPLLGYGYSDAQNALDEKYKDKGYIFPLKESYNAHNLWLQSWLENGLLAIIVLLGMFIFLLKQSRSKHLFIAFVMILLVNSMFEGLFNRFSGISFFSFLVCFIFSIKKGAVVKL